MAEELASLLYRQYAHKVVCAFPQLDFDFAEQTLDPGGITPNLPMIAWKTTSSEIRKWINERLEQYSNYRGTGNYIPPTEDGVGWEEVYEDDEDWDEEDFDDEDSDDENYSLTSPRGLIEDFEQPIPNVPIWSVETSSHGGYMVPALWATTNLIEAACAHKTCLFAGKNFDWFCYEEDVDGRILEYAYPPLRSANVIEESLIEYMKRWLPFALEDIKANLSARHLP